MGTPSVGERAVTPQSGVHLIHHVSHLFVGPPTVPGAFPCFTSGTCENCDKGVHKCKHVLLG